MSENFGVLKIEKQVRNAEWCFYTTDRLQNPAVFGVSCVTTWLNSMWQKRETTHSVNNAKFYQYVCSVCVRSVSVCMWNQYRNKLKCQLSGESERGSCRCDLLPPEPSLLRCGASLMTQLLPSTSWNRGNTQPKEDRAGPTLRSSHLQS